MKYLIAAYLLPCFFCWASISAQQVKTYWPNGNVKEKGEFKNGWKDGKWEEYHENGKLKTKGKYKKGKQGLYDAELNGFFENGKKWFHISYNSETRTERAEEFNDEGATIKTMEAVYAKTGSDFILKCKEMEDKDSSYIDTKSGKVYWCIDQKNACTVIYDFYSTSKLTKRTKAVELVKNMVYDIPQNNSKHFFKQLNSICEELNWDGNIKLNDEKGKVISDTTVIENETRYFFEHIYMADTLAYSKTVMNNKPYYILPPSYENYLWLKMVNHEKNLLFEMYSDYIELPEKFPDGIWVFLYTKEAKQLQQSRYSSLRRTINDTTRYQFSTYNFVRFLQNFKNHKATGGGYSFFFHTTTEEGINNKMPIKIEHTAKYQPLQFNAQEAFGNYTDGKKDGVFYWFLLDGVTSRACANYEKGTQNGNVIFYSTDELISKLTPPFIHYSEIQPSGSDGSNQKVDIEVPRRGYYKRYNYTLDNFFDQYGNKGNYVMLQESYGIPQAIGLELKIEDTITNLQNVIAKNKAKCKYYSEVYHDENGTVTKYITYRYGKLKQFGIMEPSPVWTQSPKKIKLEEYDNEGKILSRATFDYKKKVSFTTTFKNGKMIKTEKDKFWAE